MSMPTHRTSGSVAQGIMYGHVCIACTECLDKTFCRAQKCHVTTIRLTIPTNSFQRLARIRSLNPRRGSCLLTPQGWLADGRLPEQAQIPHEGGFS
jgi:hypothetical protein